MYQSFACQMHLAGPPESKKQKEQALWTTEGKAERREGEGRTKGHSGRGNFMMLSATQRGALPCNLNVSCHSLLSRVWRAGFVAVVF